MRATKTAFFMRVSGAARSMLVRTIDGLLVSEAYAG